MKNKFDQQIRDMMGNHQVPYDDASWNVLEQKMSHVDMTGDESIDDRVLEAVNNLEVPYNPATWEILSERLDRINYRKRLIASKVFEAAVIFFAIFTMVKFLGQIPQVQELLPKSLVNKTWNETRDEEYVVNSTDDSHLNKTGDTKSIGSNVNGSKLPQAEINLDPQTSSLAPEIARLPLAGQKINRSYVIRALDDNRSVRDVSVIEKRDLAVSEPIRTLEKQKEKYDAVPMIPVFDMSMLQAETAHDFHVLAAVKPEPKVKTKIGAFYQHNRHIVHRFVDQGTVPKQTLPISDAQGFVANLQFGRLGFDLGASYGEISYSAGYGETTIKKLQIPLNLRYEGIHTKYANFYALAGASAHAVLHAKYAPPALENAAPGGNPNSRRKYNDGLFETGYSKGNTYFSLNGGLGVDIPLTKSFSIFAETIYQHHLKESIGYTDDKISTYSFNIGVTTKL